MKNLKELKESLKKYDRKPVVIDNVIHFRYGINEKDSFDDGEFVDGERESLENQKKIKEESSHPTKDIEDWYFEKHPDNEKLGSDPKEISEKLSPGRLSEHEEKHEARMDAVADYTNDDSNPLNKALVHGKELGEHRQNIVKHLDETINDNPAPHDHVLYSGIRFNPTEQIGNNKLFTSRAYTSATHDKSVAFRFTKPISGESGSNIRHILEIKVPKGARSTNVSRYSGQANEHESIIARNSVFRHEGTTEMVHPATGDIYHVHHVTLLHPNEGSTS
jgi:hypothetical protein